MKKSWILLTKAEFCCHKLIYFFPRGYGNEFSNLIGTGGGRERIKKNGFERVSKKKK